MFPVIQHLIFLSPDWPNNDKTVLFILKDVHGLIHERHNSGGELYQGGAVSQTLSSYISWKKPLRTRLHMASLYNSILPIFSTETYFNSLGRKADGKI